MFVFPVDQPSLIMLCGIPGTGKTTWAMNVALHILGAEDTCVVSTDSYIENAASELGITYDEAFAKYIGEATRRLDRNVLQAARDKKHIIWDQTNITAKARMNKLAKIPDVYHRTAVWFPIPSDHDERLKSRVGKTIPDPVMKTMVKQFCAPTVEEGFDQIIEMPEVA